MSYIKSEIQLDAIFAALADPTRRSILQHLSKGQATVNELAEPFSISQPAISRHLKVLEHAGLVERFVEQQTRPARLNAQNMMAAVAWLEEFRKFWDGSFDQLDMLLDQMKQDNEKGK